jgi:type IV pilus assembly protein PilX
MAMFHTTAYVARATPYRNQGAVLVVALIILMLVSVLALGASRSALFQQRMAGGLRNAQLAEWTADSTLRAAEWRLWSASTHEATRLRCGSGAQEECYRVDPQVIHPTVDRFRYASGWVEQAGTVPRLVDYTVPGTDKSFQLARYPRYLIEDLGPQRGPAGGPRETGASGGSGHASIEPHLYRITARATGATDHVIRVVESTFSAKAD